MPVTLYSFYSCTSSYVVPQTIAISSCSSGVTAAKLQHQKVMPSWVTERGFSAVNVEIKFAFKRRHWRSVHSRWSLVRVCWTHCWSLIDNWPREILNTLMMAMTTTMMTGLAGCWRGCYGSPAPMSRSNNRSWAISQWLGRCHRRLRHFDCALLCLTAPSSAWVVWDTMDCVVGRKGERARQSRVVGVR